MLQCAGSCVSSDARRAGCRLHCSDRTHRLLMTAREKGRSGQFLLPSTKTRSAVLPEATSKHGHVFCTTRQDTSVSCASHLNRALLVQPHVRHGQQHVLVQRLHLPLALQVLTLRYQLEEQAQTQRCCSQRNPRVTALQRSGAPGSGRALL